MSTPDDDLIRTLAHGLNKAPTSPKLRIEDWRLIARHQLEHMRRAGLELRFSPPAKSAAHIARGANCPRTTTHSNVAKNDKE